MTAALECDRYSVDQTATAEDALSFLQTFSYDLVVLDWELPKQSGPEICRQIKARYPGMPVIMLTARTGSRDTIFGLDAGADDYLSKPCSTDELLARIRALLRRQRHEAEHIMQCGKISLEEHAHTCRINGSVLELSKREWELMRFFVLHPDQEFTAESIFLRVWPDRTEISKDLVRMYVKKLRDKIAKHMDCSPISAQGSGYRLNSKDCN